MSSAINPIFEYASVLETAIAVGPAWTPITPPASRPIATLFITHTSPFFYEISIDGMNPILLLLGQNPGGGGPINIGMQFDLKQSNLQIRAGTVIYARRLAGAPAVTDLFAVTLIEPSIQA